MKVGDEIYLNESLCVVIEASFGEEKLVIERKSDGVRFSIRPMTLDEEREYELRLQKEPAERPIK